MIKCKGVPRDMLLPGMADLSRHLISGNIEDRTAKFEKAIAAYPQKEIYETNDLIAIIREACFPRA